jgi:hypothetical protein
MASENKVKVAYTLDNEIYDLESEKKVSSSVKLFLNQEQDSLLITNHEGHVLFKVHASESQGFAHITVETT